MSGAPKALPQLAFARMRAQPDLGSVQFSDNYVPALPAGSYTIKLSHALTVPGQTGVPDAFQAEQNIAVQGPQFAIDPTAVQSFYPADGGSCEGHYSEAAGDTFQLTLPYVVLGDPTLPWERDPTPGTAVSTPWLALLLFQEDEIDVDPATSSSLTQISVQQFINGRPTILPPKMPEPVTDPDVLNSNCQVVTVKGASFQSVLPALADLPLLAHCRASNVDSEDGAMVAVVLANRLAIATSASTRYFAHLVSLEGFADYLPSGSSALPLKLESQDPVDVRLVSLANWRFTATNDEGIDYEALVKGLIASETATATLALPVPRSRDVDDVVTTRLRQGFTPLSFVTGACATSFAWCRGPLTAEPPQPVPQSNGQPVSTTAASSDALMIYLAEEGLFDLSYADAWQIGRGLALADSSFAQAMIGFRRSASAALATITQRRATPHLADADAAALLAPKVTRRRFAELFAQGMGERWNSGLKTAHRGGRRAAARHAGKPPHPRDVLASSGVAAALADRLADPIHLIADWLLDLTLLKPVPFAHLVPNPAMLPAESIRFFYVDPSWLQALVAGASSIAIHGTADLAIHLTLNGAIQSTMQQRRRARLRRPAPGADPLPALPGSGLLIRSQLVAAYPQLVIQGMAGGQTLTIARNDCPASSVRLCLFDGVPDRVTLSEPYQGLRFGINDQGIPVRTVAANGPGGTGAIQPGVFMPQSGTASAFVSAFCRQTAANATNGVLQPQTLAQALASPAGGTIAGGALGLQLIQLPELQAFTPQAE